MATGFRGMPRELRKELAATVLVEALYGTDKVACAKYGIGVRSLQKYRQRLAEDPELADLFARKKNAYDKAWIDEAPAALRSAILFIKESADACRADAAYRKNPLVIQSIAGAMKLLAEVQLTSRIVEARLSENEDAGTFESDRTSNELVKQIPSPEEYIQ